MGSEMCIRDRLCKLICSRSTLSSADVKAVLDSLNWAMDLELSSGNVVQLGEFGNFRMSINSEGTNTPEDFDATKIKGARIIFFPGSALRTTRNEVNFEPLEVTKKSADSDSESPDEI